MKGGCIRDVVRVAHVISGDIWAGVEAQVYHLITAAKNSPSIEILAILFNEGVLSRRLREVDIPVTILDESKHSTAVLVIALAREIRRKDIDVVHTHRLKENLVGGLAAAMCSRPSIRTVHGGEEHVDNPVISRRYWALTLDRFIGRYLQYTAVAVANHLSENLKEILGKDKIVIIPNGIDVDDVREAANAVPAVTLQSVAVGFLGRLVPVKRVDVFLQIADVLRRRHPGRYKFYVVGDGPLRSQLVDQARNLSLADECSFLGFIPEAMPLLKQLGVMVLTSDHEGSPVSVLEALALGVPVVAPPVGDLADILIEPKRGQLVMTRSTSEYADAIEGVLSRSAGGSAVAFPADRSIRQCAERYNFVYRDAIAQHARKANISP